MRYTYGTMYATLRRAELALEDMLESGEVTQGEKPKIEPVYHAAVGKKKRQCIGFDITLEM